MANNFAEVEDYQSDLEFDVEVTSLKKPRAKKVSKVWTHEKVFKSAEEAKNAIKEEKIWSYSYSNKTEEGKKVYYRCNQVKFKGKQCDSALHLLYDSRSDEVILFRAEAEHKHEENMSKSAISNEAKELIKELFKLKIKPKRMLEIFHERGIKPVPTTIQLRNQLNKIRNEVYGPPVISLGELENWLQSSSSIPELEDEAFVVNYKITYADEYECEESNEESDEDEENHGSKFRFFISTIRLLKLASASTILNADATYKLVWQGYPILIIGTTDLDRHFHSFGLGICTNEKTADFNFIFSSINIGLKKINASLFNPRVLISDASNAIRKAYSQVFNKNEIVMCWAHMRRNCVKKIESLVAKEDQNELIEDVDQLQLSQSQVIFEKASSLFVKKWRQKKATEFLDYMNVMWLTTHNTPSTNNNLESNNRVLKDEETIRERTPLSRFSKQALDIVKKWSLAYPRSLKEFITKQSIDTALWTQSYQWAKESKAILSVPQEQSTNNYVSASDATITQEHIDKVEKMRWTTFDQFTKRAFTVWRINLPNDKADWADGQYT